MKLEQEESWNALRRKHDVRLKDTSWKQEQLESIHEIFRILPFLFFIGLCFEQKDRRGTSSEFDSNFKFCVIETVDTKYYKLHDSEY
jgi:hypothetical protein